MGSPNDPLRRRTIPSAQVQPSFARDSCYIEKCSSGEGARFHQCERMELVNTRVMWEHQAVNSVATTQKRKTSMSYKIFVVIWTAFIVLVSPVCNSEPIGKELTMNSPESHSIDGTVLQHILVAYDDFSKNEKKIGNFAVGYKDFNGEVEVIFVPKFDQKEGMVLGGRTALGREVHYHISKEDKKITKKHYAR